MLTAAPFWPGFNWTIYVVPQVLKAPFIPFLPADNVTYQITEADTRRVVAQNPSARFFVICNPQNPLGIMHSKANLEGILQFLLQETGL